MEDQLVEAEVISIGLQHWFMHYVVVLLCVFDLAAINNKIVIVSLYSQVSIKRAARLTTYICILRAVVSFMF